MNLNRLRKKSEKAKLAQPTQAKKGNLLAKAALSVSDKGKKVQHADIYRIVDLPLTYPMTKDELLEFSREHVLAGAFADGFRLLPSQANGLLSYIMYDGILGPIGVGEGKTILSLMVANEGYRKGIEKILLLVPPEVLGQLVNKDIKEARTKVPISYPVHVLGGRPPAARRSIAASGRKGLYIMPYSLLSTKDAEELLWNIAPDLIIGDEAHRLASSRAARTRRLMKYVDSEDPECVFLSGTITSKSINEYGHLSRAALKQHNPLPNKPSLVREWAAIVDSEQVNWSEGTSGYTRTGPGPLTPLIRWLKKHKPEEEVQDDQEGFRKAFKHRLITAPGVVSSSKNSIKTSLMLCNSEVQDYKKCEGWETLSKHIENVEKMYLTPNKDEIDHAIHAWKWLYELSAGFYNELTWPTPDVFAKRKSISEGEAEDILERAKDHHAAGQLYHSLLRKWLQRYHKTGMDTPKLVGQEMQRNQSKNVGRELYEAWSDWKKADFQGRPDRDKRAVRVCPFKIDAAVEWAKQFEGQGSICWVFSIEMGAWLYEATQKVGLDSVYCPAGARGNEAILDPSNGKKTIIASITSHGTGKNLQHFQHQRFVQWPRSAKTAEQALGRLHRTGQKADELFVSTCNTLPFDKTVFASCLNDALYIHQTTAVRQKLIYAQYDPLPQIWPSSVLKQRGADGIKMLNKEQIRLMEEKFGQ